MAQNALLRAIEGLRQEASGRFRDINLANLLVGTACNFAFVGYTFFSPAMTHTSALMVSYTDVAFLTGAITSGILLASIQGNRAAKAQTTALTVTSVGVVTSLFVYLIFVMCSLVPPHMMDWVSGALFGVYLPLATSSWLRVHAGFKVSVAVWNVLLSAVLGSFIMWLLSGMAPVQQFGAMAILMLVGTGTLITRIRVVPISRNLTGKPTHAHMPFYLFVAMFLFSFAFQIAIAFAELEGAKTAFATGALFAPFMFVGVLILAFRSFTALSLLNIAVPILATTTIAASFLPVDPVIMFDLAVVGVFMFLVYAVLLIFEEMQGCDRHAYQAFLLLMLSFSCGCITARVGDILCELSDAASSGIMALLSVLAVIGAMILCIKNGIIPRKLGELFRYGETTDSDAALSVREFVEVDHITQERNLGAREKEVLILLLQKKSASEIAAELVIANGTAKSHIRHVYKKLGIHSRSELFDIFV